MRFCGLDNKKADMPDRVCPLVTFLLKFMNKNENNRLTFQSACDRMVTYMWEYAILRPFDPA